MSEIDYNNLLFEVSKRLNQLDRLLFLCRRQLSESEDSIEDVLSLFKKLEAGDHLGPDRLGLLKNLLRHVKEYLLLEEVKKFENDREEYCDLLKKIIPVLDELNDMERLASICKIEANEDNICNVRSLFKELEIRSCLGPDSLGILKKILAETRLNDLLTEVEQFEQRRNLDDAFETRKAQASAFVSSVGSRLTGVLNIKTVFKVVAGGIITASTLDVWSRGSSFDQLVTAVNRCVLPAGTSLLQITEGCVRLTVQAENLSALRTLWTLYKDKTLKSRLQTVFVTDELRELAGGEQVEAIVTMDEGEYDKLNRGAEEEESIKKARWNSDSCLYCKVRDGKGSTEGLVQPEKGFTSQAKYLDQQKLVFVHNFLNQSADVHSVTTETSDSGMPGTYGAPSELCMEEASSNGAAPNLDASHTLCLKDLSEALLEEVTFRLEGDPVSEKWFRHSFGLHYDRGNQQGWLMGSIRKTFPDTPVKQLIDVFEALKLFDLVELLEKAKPRLLRLGLPLKEIEKLPHPVDRPTTFCSKASVLIINDCRNAEDHAAQRIGSFFKTLDSRTDVTTIAAASLLEKHLALNKLLQTQKERERLVQMKEHEKEGLIDELAYVKQATEQQGQKNKKMPDYLLERRRQSLLDRKSELPKILKKIWKERVLLMKEIETVDNGIKETQKELEEEHKKFERNLSAQFGRHGTRKETGQPFLPCSTSA